MALKTVSATLPVGTSIVQYDDAIAVALGYQDTINGSPNPETKSQFARRMIIQYMTDQLKNGLITPAVTTARQNILDTTGNLT